MNVHQFWGYVGHVDSLIPIAGAVVTAVGFLSKRIRKFLAARAGEAAGLAVNAFTNVLK